MDVHPAAIVFPWFRGLSAGQKGYVDMTASAAALVPGTPGGRTLRLSALLGRPLTDRQGESIGRLSDVIVRLRGADHPLVTGFVGKVGGRDGRQVFIPLDQVEGLDTDEMRLTSARLDLRKFERRDGEVLLRADVLGHRLVDVASAQLVKAGDLELRETGAGWVLWAVDTHHRAHGILRLLSPADHGERKFQDWTGFEPLIGHAGSALLRGPFARIRRLKPAQIADLLEQASKAEENEILGQVHADPELEADVFEELEEDRATRLLGARTNSEIAEVLTRMRADDAADAIAELPQHRRQPVLDLLPPGQRTKVLTLMGFNPTSAGGLMGVDYVVVPATSVVAEVVAAVSGARSLQPEALTSVHALDEQGRLCGVAKLVTLLQADQAARLSEVYEDDPVRIGADTDVVDVAVLMSDYNLITIPVVDENRMMIGLITVDDVLEVTLPEDWRRREAAEPPDSRRGKSP